MLDRTRPTNSSRRSSAASTTLKVLKKVANFPEIIGEQGEDEYVFDKQKQIWRTREKKTPLLMVQTEQPRLSASANRKQSRLNSFFSSRPFHRNNSKPIINSAAADWILLATLGILMAMLSYAMDTCIHFLQHSRDSLMEHLVGNLTGRFVAWTVFCVSLVLIAAIFCRKVASQSIGSGIPEMKTIIRGVMLKEYLTFRTLVAKVFGLSLALSSGVPVGKEGPFVHIGSIVAHQLSKASKNLQGVYGNESRRSEMLAAGCAVGVACTFSAPVGGVLYSIEATSVYFGMRNYARCFLAATFSATVFRLLQVSINKSDTVIALYQTNFPKDCFQIEEIPLFIFLGLVCGLLAAFYVYLQRNVMYFIRRNGLMKLIYQKYWILYPLIITFGFSAVTFPDFLGQFFAGERLFGETVRDFFGNCSWILTNSSAGCSMDELGVWSNHGHSPAIQVLGTFLIVSFIFVTLCSTLPVPLGAFVPSFVIGGAVGRLFGELLLFLFPEKANIIYPGIYAAVGAASFCGGATHSVSVAVIVYEVTGQLEFALPLLIGVLAAHAVCTHLQPSLYDSVIKIKKLPYLKDISHISHDFIGIEADQFMVSDVHFVSKDSTLGEIRDLLIKFPRVRTFPICDSKKNQILIGSCGREKLIEQLRKAIGQKARLAEVSRRAQEKRNSAIEKKEKPHFEKDPSPPSTESNMFSNSAAADLLSMTTASPNSFNSSNPFHVKAETEALLEKSSMEDDSKSFSGRLIHFTRNSMRRLSRPHNGATILDMDPEERNLWENERLAAKVDLDAIEFDSAPFQLVDRAPLLHVHMMFSLLGLQRAYITNRRAQEKRNSAIEKKEKPHFEKDPSPPSTESNMFSNSAAADLLSMTTASPNSFNSSNPFHVKAETEALLEKSSMEDDSKSFSGRLIHFTRNSMRRLSRPHNGATILDMDPEERNLWENERLATKVDLDAIEFDSAPFQLVDRAPLLHVHMMFSLLGLQRAYITKCGQLVGLISMRDLRTAIEAVKNGHLVARPSPKKSQLFLNLNPSILNKKEEIDFKN
uniref:Chloride channel protein n=2 Tax=Panagrolaimus sp. JU765 TaxID=591449 RepID=A0AC34R7L1_9BILA